MNLLGSLKIGSFKSEVYKKTSCTDSKVAELAASTEVKFDRSESKMNKLETQVMSLDGKVKSVSVLADGESEVDLLANLHREVAD